MKTKLFSTLIITEHAGQQYSLRSSGSKAEFLDGLGEKVGSLFKYSDPERGTTFDLPEELPLAVQVFVFWMALILWGADSG